MRKILASVLRRRVPPFAIVSLPRCGSTALFRALSLGSMVRIEYEPDFGDSWSDRARLEEACSALFSRASGIKHVWDPNGWPFTNKSHQSTLETLARSEEWIEVNASVLECTRKVVFLRRRNQLARVVSDLLGQQTDLWGHDPSGPRSENEAAEYRAQLSLRSLERLDEQVIDWYLRNALAWEDRIVARIPEHRRLTVHYEDLFGADVDLDARLARVSGIADWLGIGLRVRDERVRAVLQPSSKLNAAGSYERIPNLAQIVARFGPI